MLSSLLKLQIRERNNMILDLSQFKEEYFEIPFPNGTNVRVKKPTERIFIDFLKLNSKLNDNEIKNGGEDKRAEFYISAIDEMLLIILNNNADMKIYKNVDIEWMSIDIKTYIINEYSKFMSNLLSHPN